VQALVKEYYSNYIVHFPGQNKVSLAFFKPSLMLKGGHTSQLYIATAL